MHYIAELRNVALTDHLDRDDITFQVAWGNIYNDTATYGNHPMRDGADIHTSKVDRIATVGDDKYIITRNSTYKVIGDIKYQGKVVD